MEMEKKKRSKEKYMQIHKINDSIKEPDTALGDLFNEERKSIDLKTYRLRSNGDTRKSDRLSNKRDSKI